MDDAHWINMSISLAGGGGVRNHVRSASVKEGIMVGDGKEGGNFGSEVCVCEYKCCGPQTVCRLQSVHGVSVVMSQCLVKYSAHGRILKNSFQIVPIVWCVSFLMCVYMVFHIVSGECLGVKCW